MSDARVRLLLEGDAKGAQQALAQTKAALADIQKSVGALGQASDATSAEIIDLSQAAQTATREIVELAEAEQRAAIEISNLSKNSMAAKIAMGAVAESAGKVSKSVGKGPDGAAGAMGSLVAQFDDVGMMLAGGQNPLQLAIQQGTQISQVIGPMGAAGAVRALGGAFLGALNPVNLAVMGVLGGLGLLMQHLRSGRDEVLSLSDAMSQLETSTGDWQRALQDAQQPFAKLVEQFGAGAAEAREVYQALFQLARLDFLDGIEAAGKSIKADLSGIMREVDLFNRMTLTTENLSPDRQALILKSAQGAIQRLREEYGLTINEAVRLNTAVNALAAAEGPRQVAEAASRLRDTISQIEAETGKISPEMRNVLKATAETELAARGFLAKMGESVGSINAANSAASGMAATMAGVRAEVAGIASILSSIGGGMIQNAAKFAELQALRAGANAKEAVKQGEQLIRETERRAADMGGSFADRLARRAKVAIADVGDFVADQIEKEHKKQRDTERAALAETRAGAGRVRSGGGGGGGGRIASEADRERRAIEDLIQSQQRELDIIRAKNPVQAELLRHREALAQATSAERAQVERLIETRQQEEAAASALKEQWDFLGQSALDALNGLIFQGESATDVINNLVKSLGQAVLQSMLLGTGPLAGLFGTAGTGGLFCSFAGSFATGGYITGPGNGTSDSIAIRASSGEFMVNAKATAQHRPILEAINAGGLPGFARGGLIGAGPEFMPAPPVGAHSGTATGTGGRFEGRLEVALSSDLRAEMTQIAGDMSVKMVREGLRQYTRHALPEQARRRVSDVRSTG